MKLYTFSACISKYYASSFIKLKAIVTIATTLGKPI